MAGAGALFPGVDEDLTQLATEVVEGFGIYEKMLIEDPQIAFERLKADPTVIE